MRNFTELRAAQLSCIQMRKTQTKRILFLATVDSNEIYIAPAMESDVRHSADDRLAMWVMIGERMSTDERSRAAGRTSTGDGLRRVDVSNLRTSCDDVGGR